MSQQNQDIKKQVGTLIREARQAKYLTQKELGKKLGVTESTYNRYETGTANLSIETLEKIAESLDLKARVVFE